jgi:hypothetical protein
MNPALRVNFIVISTYRAVPVTKVASIALPNRIRNVGSEVFTAVSMDNAVLWDVAACGSCKNRRFGEMRRLHLQGRRIILNRGKVLDGC